MKTMTITQLIEYADLAKRIGVTLIGDVEIKPTYKTNVATTPPAEPNLSKWNPDKVVLMEPPGKPADKPMRQPEAFEKIRKYVSTCTSDRIPQKQLFDLVCWQTEANVIVAGYESWRGAKHATSYMMKSELGFEAQNNNTRGGTVYVRIQRLKG